MCREGHMVSGNIQSRIQVQCFQLYKDIWPCRFLEWEKNAIWDMENFDDKDRSKYKCPLKWQWPLPLHSNTCHGAEFIFPPLWLGVSLLIKDLASDNGLALNNKVIQVEKSSSRLETWGESSRCTWKLTVLAPVYLLGQQFSISLLIKYFGIKMLNNSHAIFFTDDNIWCIYIIISNCDT